jgi:hypothetical protein
MAARRAVRVAVASAVLALAAAPAARAAHPEVDRCDWPMYGHDLGHSFAAASGCSSLRPTNAPTRNPPWVLTTPHTV